jgi:DNA polymerase-3 subunit gamma/tau
MENFVVSARKYRPATFETVIGQEHITDTLKNAIRSNHLAHAFLFCGPRGVGKTTCARILAKTINCSNITSDIEACNECDSCRTFNQNASFNIYELDAASNNSVEDMRSLVEQVRYPPQGSKYKIYIIDEVHMLSTAAFNAFLKTLEEPPPYAKFILATTERHKILPTILSRCQVFDFHRIKIEHAVNQLKKICANEQISFEEEALHMIAQKADGAMRDALSIFDRIVSYSGKNILYKDVISNLNILDYDYYFRATEMLLNQDMGEILLLFDQILNNGFDVQHFLMGMNEHFRNLMMCKQPNTIKLMEVAPSVANKFMEQSSLCSKSFLLNALNLLNKCEIDLRMSKNMRLHVELYLLKIANIQSLIQHHSGEPDIKKKTDVSSVVSTHQTSHQPNQEPSQPAPLEVTNNAVSDSNAPKIETPTPIKKDVSYNPPTGIHDKLKQLRNKVTQELNSQNDKLENAVNEAKPEIEADNPIQTNMFEDTFTKYINHLDATSKMSISVIYKNLKWSIIDENNIEFTLSSNLEVQMLNDDRMHLMPWLRQNLKNSKIEYTTVVNQQHIPDKVFTSDDKFKVMLKQNPALHEFRNTFELDID